MPSRRPSAAAVAASASAFAVALVLASVAASAAASGKPARAPKPDPLPLETLTVQPLEPAGPKRLYLSDVALPHIVDGKLHVIDGDTMRYRGLVATGYAGQATLSADRRTLYVATSYYTRLSRGERTDVVDVYDAGTLAHSHEIVIPPKHAQALNYKGLIAVSADDRWVFVQNATPAVSVSVVDTRARTFVQEIDTPGCWTVQPVRSPATTCSATARVDSGRPRTSPALSAAGACAWMAFPPTARSGCTPAPGPAPSLGILSLHPRSPSSRPKRSRPGTKSTSSSSWISRPNSA
jgi:hypothetical protein